MIDRLSWKLYHRYSEATRGKRGTLFRERLRPTEQDRILDLGGHDGSHISSVIPFRDNVWIADIDEEALRRAREQFGFRTTPIPENGPLPFPDQFFDIVFCSSVIEHVTLPKDQLQRVLSTHEFQEAAIASQKTFADEIRRIAKHFFVQTPHRFFFLESHTWLPVFIVFLPRRILVPFLKFQNRWWPKKTIPDFHLLTTSELASLFPNAEIVVERSYGFAKSIVAVTKREF